MNAPDFSLVDWGNPVSDYALNRDLLGWWLPGSPGFRSGTLFDLTGKRHGVLTSMDSTDWLADSPSSSGCLDFDAAGSQKVRITTDPGDKLNLASPCTVALWFRKNGWVTSDGFVGKFDTTSTNRIWGLWTSQVENNVGFFRYNVGTFREVVVNSSTFYSDAWCFVAGVVRSLSSWSIYAWDGNGKLFSSSSGLSVTNNTTANPMTIGNYTDVHANYITARITDVRVWRRALTVDELRGVYLDALEGYPRVLNRWSMSLAKGTAAAGGSAFPDVLGGRVNDPIFGGPVPHR